MPSRRPPAGYQPQSPIAPWARSSYESPEAPPGHTRIRPLRSLLGGAVLAIAAVLPAAGIAAEPDRSQEGGISPDVGQSVDTDSPTYDPGGDTDLPYDSGWPTVPSAEGPSSHEGPVEIEPVDDPAGRLAPPSAPEQEASGLAEETPVQPLEAAQPTPPTPPGFAIEAPRPDDLAAESAPAPTPTAQTLGAEPGARPQRRPRRLSAAAVVAPRRIVHPAAPTGGQGDTAGAAVQPRSIKIAATVLTPEASDPGAESDGGAGHPEARRGPRFHAVQPGESLWTIAEDLLGPAASSVHIAAEVARLWELNRERIPSANPDLIAVGQRLRLR